MLISNPVNIRYLTGLNLSRGFVVVTPRAYTLFANDLYREGATRNASEGVRVRGDRDLERVMAKLPICGFEEGHVTVAQQRHWKTKFSETKLVRTAGAVEEFRRTKDDAELKLIRRAHRITQEILRRVPAALRVGITERGLAWKIETWAHDLGADGLAFPPCVSFGSHTSRPHHEATTRALQKGHVVMVDVGAMYKGYCADRCQMYFTEDPTDVQARALKAVQTALDTVLDAVKPGASTKALDQLVRDVLAEHDYETHEIMPHALGHGVGLEVHDPTVLSPRAEDRKLQAGEVIALEPALYFQGKFGIRLEEMVIVE